MQGIRSVGLTGIIFLFAASAACAGPCKGSIDELQARVDAAIEHQAATEQWKPESLGALRNHQPTPQSIAASEGSAGKKFRGVLVLLKRARAADRTGNPDRCNAATDKARSAFNAL